MVVSRELVDFLDQQDLLVVVDFAEFDFDDFPTACRHVFADVGSFDREFAMTAVDQYRQLHASGTPVVKERVQGRSNGSPGVEHVVTKYDVPSVDIEAEIAGVHYGPRTMGAQVVAVELNVQDPSFNWALDDAAHENCQSLGQWYTAAFDADQGERFTGIGFFDDLVGQPDQGAINLGCRHQPAFFAQFWSGLQCLAHQ